MSPLACRLAEVGDDLEGRFSMSRHAGHCLRCQARAARNHRIERHLRALRSELELAPAGFESAVMGRIRGEAPRAPRAPGLPRVAATAGAVVAGAAGAVALTLWRRTHSPA